MVSMRPLHISFAPSPWRCALRRVSALDWLLLAAGLALCAWTAWAWQRQEKALTGLRAELAQVQALASERRSRARPAVVQAVPPAQAAAVAALIGQLNLPWDDLLDALERADQAGVAVLELTPLPRQRLLRGTAEARDPAAMLAFVRRLQGQTAFDGAHLVRHEHTDGDPTQPVRFEFEAAWRLEAP